VQNTSQTSRDELGLFDGVYDYQVRGCDVSGCAAPYSPTASTEVMDMTTSYSYDALGRLKTVTYPDGKVVTFGYDESGNRETLTITGSQ